MLTDYLIKRRLKKEHIPVEQNANTHRDCFKRVLNTLRNNRVMVETRPDGVYIRVAGSVEKGEAFSLDWARVIKFKSDYSQIGKDITYPSSLVVSFGPACNTDNYTITWQFDPGRDFRISKYMQTFTHLEDAQEFKKRLESQGMYSKIRLKQNIV